MASSIVGAGGAVAGAPQLGLRIRSQQFDLVAVTGGQRLDILDNPEPPQAVQAPHCVCRTAPPGRKGQLPKKSSSRSQFVASVARSSTTDHRSDQAGCGLDTGNPSWSHARAASGIGDLRAESPKTHMLPAVAA